MEEAGEAVAAEDVVAVEVVAKDVVTTMRVQAMHPRSKVFVLPLEPMCLIITIRVQPTK